MTNQIVATIPVGQLPQALVYVPGAVTSNAGSANLKPLGITSEALHLELVSANASATRASVSVNSLGLIDNLQIAATGLTPGRKYKLSISGDHREDLSIFSAGVGGVAIVQTQGPLKHGVDIKGSDHSAGLEVWSADGAEMILQIKK